MLKYFNIRHQDKPLLHRFFQPQDAWGWVRLRAECSVSVKAQNLKWPPTDNYLEQQSTALTDTKLTGDGVMVLWLQQQFS